MRSGRRSAGGAAGSRASIPPTWRPTSSMRIVTRHDVDPAAVDDVILGCLDNIGAQAGDIARTAALAAGLPESVPGVTIDRQCGSSQQAVHFAAQAVMSGTADLVVAGGVQKMSQYPILSAFGAGEPFGATDPWTGCRGWESRYGDPGDLAVPRRGNDRRAMEAQPRGQRALRPGEPSTRARGDRVRAASTARSPRTPGFRVDEGPRADTSLEKMAALPDPDRRRRPHGRGGQPDLGRRGRLAHRVAGRGRSIRSDTARPDPSHVGARRAIP